MAVLGFLRENWAWMLSFAATAAGITGIVYHRQKALELGLQALLRAQMITDYNHYLEKGYAPIYARENFENMWRQYDRLGGNGVMKDIRDKFLALPAISEKKVRRRGPGEKEEGR